MRTRGKPEATVQGCGCAGGVVPNALTPPWVSPRAQLVAGLVGVAAGQLALAGLPDVAPEAASSVAIMTADQVIVAIAASDRKEGSTFICKVGVVGMVGITPPTSDGEVS